MKKLLFTLLLSSTSAMLFAQQGNVSPNSNANAQRWKMDGNIANPNDFIGTVNETPFNIRTNNQERLKITPDGRIGVGITNPLAELHVNGNLRFSGDMTMEKYIDESMETQENRYMFIDKNGRVTPKTDVELAQDIYFLEYACLNSGDGVIPIKWSSRMMNEFTPVLFTQTGCPNSPERVGIRTNSPQATLDVRGTAITQTLTTNRITINTSSTVSNNIALLISDTEGKKILQVNNNGLLRSREVKVDTENWPDYVFQSDYSLMPLSDVKRFIHHNGHLPNIPNALEMQTDGLNLGEMQKLQMEKIEELTLYTIEQQEQLDEQKAFLQQQAELIEQQRLLLEEQKKVLEELMLNQQGK